MFSYKDKNIANTATQAITLKIHIWLDNIHGEVMTAIKNYFSFVNRDKYGLKLLRYIISSQKITK